MQHCDTWAEGALQKEQKGLTKIRRKQKPPNLQSLQTEPRNKERKCKTAQAHVNNVSYWHNFFNEIQATNEFQNSLLIKIHIAHYTLSKHSISRNSKSYIKSAVTSLYSKSLFWSYLTSGWLFFLSRPLLLDDMVQVEKRIQMVK